MEGLDPALVLVTRTLYSINSPSLVMTVLMNMQLGPIYERLIHQGMNVDNINYHIVRLNGSLDGVRFFMTFYIHWV